MPIDTIVKNSADLIQKLNEFAQSDALFNEHSTYFRGTYFEADLEVVLGMPNAYARSSVDPVIGSVPDIQNVANFNAVLNGLSTARRSTLKADFIKTPKIILFLKTVLSNPVLATGLDLSALIKILPAKEQLAFAQGLLPSGFNQVLNALPVDLQAAFIKSPEAIKLIKAGPAAAAAQGIVFIDLVNRLPEADRLAYVTQVGADFINTPEELISIMALLPNALPKDKINFLKAIPATKTAIIPTVEQMLKEQYVELVDTYISETVAVELNQNIISLTAQRASFKEPLAAAALVKLEGKINELKGVQLEANRLSILYDDQENSSQIFQQLDQLEKMKAFSQMSNLSVLALKTELNRAEGIDDYLAKNTSNETPNAFQAAISNAFYRDNKGKHFRNVLNGIQSPETKAKFISTSEVKTLVARNKIINLPELLALLPDHQTRLAYANELLSSREAVKNLIDDPRQLTALMESLDGLSMSAQIDFFKEKNKYFDPGVVETALINRQIAIFQKLPAAQRLAAAVDLVIYLNAAEFQGVSISDKPFLKDILTLLNLQQRVDFFLQVEKRQENLLTPQGKLFGEAARELLIDNINTIPQQDVAGFLAGLEKNEGFTQGIRLNQFYTFDLNAALNDIKSDSRKVAFLLAPEIKNYIEKHSLNLLGSIVSLLEQLPGDVRLDYARGLLDTPESIQSYQEGYNPSLEKFLAPLTLEERVQLLAEKKSISPLIAPELARASRELIIARMNNTPKASDFFDFPEFTLALQGMDPKEMNDVINGINDPERKIQFMLNSQVQALIKEKNIDIVDSLKSLPSANRLAFVQGFLSPEYFQAVIKDTDKLNALLNVLSPKEKQTVINKNMSSIVNFLKSLNKPQDQYGITYARHNAALTTLLQACTLEQQFNIFLKAGAAFSGEHDEIFETASRELIINKINATTDTVANIAQDSNAQKMFAKGTFNSTEYSRHIVPMLKKIPDQNKQLQLLLMPDILTYASKNLTAATLKDVFNTLKSPIDKRFEYALALLVHGQASAHLDTLLDQLTIDDQIKLLAANVNQTAVVKKISTRDFGINLLRDRINNFSSPHDAAVFIGAPVFNKILSLVLNANSFDSMYHGINDQNVRGQLLLNTQVKAFMLKNGISNIDYLKAIPDSARLSYIEEFFPLYQGKIKTDTDLKNILQILSPKERVDFLYKHEADFKKIKNFYEVKFSAELNNPNESIKKDALENGINEYIKVGDVEKFEDLFNQIEDPKGRSVFLLAAWSKLKGHVGVTTLMGYIEKLKGSDQQVRCAIKFIEPRDVGKAQLAQLLAQFTNLEDRQTYLQHIKDNIKTFSALSEKDIDAQLAAIRNETYAEVNALAVSPKEQEDSLAAAENISRPTMSAAALERLLGTLAANERIIFLEDKKFPLVDPGVLSEITTHAKLDALNLSAIESGKRLEQVNTLDSATMSVDTLRRILKQLPLADRLTFITNKTFNRVSESELKQITFVAKASLGNVALTELKNDFNGLNSEDKKLQITLLFQAVLNNENTAGVKTYLHELKSKQPELYQELMFDIQRTPDLLNTTLLKLQDEPSFGKTNMTVLINIVTQAFSIHRDKTKSPDDKAMIGLLIKFMQDNKGKAFTQEHKIALYLMMQPYMEQNSQSDLGKMLTAVYTPLKTDIVASGALALYNDAHPNAAKDAKENFNKTQKTTQKQASSSCGKGAFFGFQKTSGAARSVTQEGKISTPGIDNNNSSKTVNKK
jgi:hypothetical protein